MDLKVYNTLTKKKEKFIPLNKERVNMYVCGPTVYDTSHIGHARCVVVFDVIFRWLKSLKYKVNYVRNFTDVDDKIIKKSIEEGLECKVITEKYIQEFHNEMDALNVLRPSVEPKATDHIRHIIDFIKMLINREKAYYIEGSGVYFSIDSCQDYGRLSGRNPEDMKAGARIEKDEKKKNPLDFVLWKPSKPGEPFWESPWGKGRPGWHIECSAMSYEYLGKGFDIHGGGKDLIFPHHENELAQSEAVFGSQFVKYWIHNGFVDINNEKMSKSLGNFTMIKEVLKKYSPEVIRMFLLSKHYRSPIDFSQKAMREASLGLDRVYAFFERLEKAGVKIDISKKGALWNDFTNAMNDDFNCAKALGLVFEAVKKGNKLLDAADDTLDTESFETLAHYYGDIKVVSGILGIFELDSDNYFKGKKERAMADMTVDPEEIEELIHQRNQARRDKAFSKADEIRDHLKTMDVILEDGPQGTTWRFE